MRKSRICSALLFLMKINTNDVAAKEYWDMGGGGGIFPWFHYFCCSQVTFHLNTLNLWPHVILTFTAPSGEPLNLTIVERKDPRRVTLKWEVSSWTVNAITKRLKLLTLHLCWCSSLQRKMTCLWIFNPSVAYANYGLRNHTTPI